MYSNDDGPCPGGHYCNNADFALSINNTEIGAVNLNNIGGPCDPGSPNFIEFPSMVTQSPYDRATKFSLSEGTLPPTGTYTILLECRSCSDSCGVWEWQGAGEEPCKVYTSTPNSICKQP